jgi:putative transposase
MNRIKQEQVALFRYGLIFPLLDERLERGDKTRLMKEIAFREYDIPFSPRKRVTVSTLYLWLNAYKKRRSIEDLFPQIRQDKGSSRTLSSETELALRAFRELHPQDPSPHS